MQKIDAIPFHTIRVGRWIDFDLFTYDQENNLIRILKKDELYSSYLRNKLVRTDMTRFFVRWEEKEAYYRYLERNLMEMAADGRVSLSEKTSALYDGSARILEKIFEEPGDVELHAKVKEIVRSAVDIVQADPRAIKNLKEAGLQLYSNHTHSVDVAIFALGFGRYLGFSRNEMLKLGYSAMMHDIGKSRVDDTILSKNGPLSDTEFEQVKRHANYGYFILRAQNETDEDVLNGVRFHHEKCDGTGYPEKRKDSEIPFFAKVISLADVFSALSTNRYHKEACTSYEALLTMKDEMITGFDKKLLLEFIRFMGPPCQEVSSPAPGIITV